jgi:hypothetical protein
LDSKVFDLEGPQQLGGSKNWLLQSQSQRYKEELIAADVHTTLHQHADFANIVMK